MYTNVSTKKSLSWKIICTTLSFPLSPAYSNTILYSCTNYYPPDITTIPLSLKQPSSNARLQFLPTAATVLQAPPSSFLSAPCDHAHAHGRTVNTATHSFHYPTTTPADQDSIPPLRSPTVRPTNAQDLPATYLGT